MPVQNDDLLIRPEKLMTVRKQLEERLARRERARMILQPKRKEGLLHKLKRVLGAG